MATQYTSKLSLKGLTDPTDVRLLSTVVEGAINEIPVAYLEFLCNVHTLDLGALVGTDGGVRIEGEEGHVHRFRGTCISAEAKGRFARQSVYVVEIRPWLWFLTRARNNRIYQDMTATDIIKDVLQKHGFSSKIKILHSGKDKPRIYCTQYRETDYDFVKRLIEEEGFYFYFDHTDSDVTMVISDNIAAQPKPGPLDKIPFRGQAGVGRIVHFNKWEAQERVVTGKVSLRDYNFETPGAKMEVSAEQPRGSHGHTDYESYQYPGKYARAADGELRATVLAQAEASAHQTWQSGGNVLHLAPGRLFALEDHEDAAEFMVRDLQMYYQQEYPEADKDIPPAKLGEVFGLAPDAGQSTLTRLTSVHSAEQFKMPRRVPRPDISGVQTAVVTVEKGEELTVDKYGRIKVRFHWDRSGIGDNTSSCWVRTMMPWTGKNWGMVAWPRVGQEVVIQFEEGDPDRPLCVGMLYNAETMPPYSLPANATRTGIKTNSSKGGGGYNELLFEDKKGSELVRIAAERDLTQTVQNSAHVKVGYKFEKDTTDAKPRDKESMKLEVRKHLDEIVETGDHHFSVKAGTQTIDVKKDKTETLHANSKLTVTGNVTETVKQGSVTQTVDMGDVTQTLKMGNWKRELQLGNQDVVCKLGNYSVKTDLGKITMEALQSIELKVLGSSIKIDPMGVTIKGPMIKVQADAMLEAKAPMSTVKGDGILILKGGLTLIN